MSSYIVLSTWPCGPLLLHVLSLLVMGMDHYGSVKAWNVIQEKLMPIKTPKQLQLRVKNACANRTGDNVIKVLESVDLTTLFQIIPCLLRCSTSRRLRR